MPFRHYKGGLYEYVCTTRGSEDPNELRVTYRALYEGDFPLGQCWSRPYEEFFGYVEEGVRRFTEV